MAGMHNLIGSLAGSGEPERAREFLDQNRHLYKDLGEISLSRLCWLESHIFVVLEQFVRAEPLLQKVREFFLSRGMGIDVLLASLDLAKVYTLSRQPRKVKEILGDVIPIGEAFGLSGDVFLARTLFERASRS